MRMRKANKENDDVSGNNSKHFDIGTRSMVFECKDTFFFKFLSPFCFGMFKVDTQTIGV